MLTGKHTQHQQFKEVFEQYYSTLCQFAYSFVKERGSSEDIVQEVFLRVWEKRPDLIGTDGLRYYLFTSVRNNCLSFLQQEKKSMIVPIDGLAVPTDLQEPGWEAEPAIDHLSLIQKGLSMLPPKCKEVFLLSRLGDLSYKQIASTLDISVKTVENQMGKALKLLRGFMKENRVFGIMWIIAGIHYIYMTVS